MPEDYTAKEKTRPRVGKKTPALRLRRIIILETVLVALAGLMVWGIAWDMNFPTAGLVAAIVIWLTVSPAIEIATVMKYREQVDRGEESIG